MEVKTIAAYFQYIRKELQQTLIKPAPAVSVIIANYNCGNYLPMCLESLVQQSFQDFEVIVIDDGSTDHSLDVCNEYVEKDHRFHTIPLKHSHNVSQVRNVGIAEAKGKYIAILDADDVALPCRLEKQVNFLKAQPEIVLLGGFYGIIDLNGNIIRKKKLLPLHDPEIRWRLTFGNCLIHSTVMYKKEAAVKCGGYNTELKYAEDMDLYSQLMCHGKVSVIPSVLSYWRSHDTSLSKKTRKKEFDHHSIYAVKLSIQRHTHQNAPYDVAAALYFNSKTPATNPESLKKGFAVITSAFDAYAGMTKTAAEKKRLSRFALKHLFKIKKRNRQQPWWPVCERAYMDTVRAITRRTDYNWYTDVHFFFPLFQFSPLHYFTLIRSALKK